MQLGKKSDSAAGLGAAERTRPDWGRTLINRGGSCMAVLALGLGACGGGGSSGGPALGGAPGIGPPPPADINSISANGAVIIDWSPVPGATGYRLHYSQNPGVVPGQTPYEYVTTPPAIVTGLAGGFTFHGVVTSVDANGLGTASPEFNVSVDASDETQYFPPWHTATPLRQLSFTYNQGQSSKQNGNALKSVIAGLVAGDELSIGTGTYTIDSLFDIQVVGTASNPIWIQAADGANVTITRSDAGQNTVNIGSGGPTRYLALRNIEVVGGSQAMRLFNCKNVWVDRCHVHDCQENAITANTVATEYLWFTRNEVHSTGGTGEGFYIGGNNSNPVAAYVTVAQNHVYDTTNSSQGDGIEIKQGSYGCLVAENIVHDTKYPSILAYGTDGNAFNVIERNLCWNALDNVMQVQGEAVVRNNILIGGQHGFFSANHQGTVTDLKFIHNTVLNSKTAVRVNDWDGKPGMVFANNICYSETGSAIIFNGGANGVSVQGNLVVGAVIGKNQGFSQGAGLSDFAGASYDGSTTNVTPLQSGAIPGSGNGNGVFTTPLDYNGDVRIAPTDAGAIDAD